MKLIEALEPEVPARIAIVGGGGKTSALFAIGRQLNGLTWTTTTTHIGTDQLTFADRHIILNSIEEIDLKKLTAQRHTLITGPFTPDERVHGPAPDIMQKLYELADQEEISLIVEADGARSHPLKAPAAHEPVIPAWSKMVIVVVGCSVFGKPLNEQWVHRASWFSSLTGLALDALVTPEVVTRMLVHPLGGLKGIPEKATRVVLFNQADVLNDLKIIKNQIPAIIQGGFDRVVIGAVTQIPDEIFVAK